MLDSYIVSRPTKRPSQSSIKDFVMLMKPRVISLVVFTSYCGIMLAPGHIHPFIAFTTIICITLGAGSAAAINMWYDRDIDSIMKRTQSRPIVVGNVHPDEAITFGVVLAFFSCFLMALCINLITAFLLAITILYYIFIYTMWTKRSSSQNVVIGGVAGALPPMIGFAAVSGNVSIESLILFLIIFMWTPPHSWALALYRYNDYKNCGIPMLPIVKGEIYTKKCILIYSILMFITSLAPYFIGMADKIYLIVATILGIIFLSLAILLFRNKNRRGSLRLFIYSIFYLFMVFSALILKPLFQQ